MLTKTMQTKTILAKTMLRKRSLFRISAVFFLGLELQACGPKVISNNQAELDAARVRAESAEVEARRLATLQENARRERDEALQTAEQERLSAQAQSAENRSLTDRLTLAQRQAQQAQDAAAAQALRAQQELANQRALAEQQAREARELSQAEIAQLKAQAHDQAVMSSARVSKLTDLLNKAHKRFYKLRSDHLVRHHIKRKHNQEERRHLKAQLMAQEKQVRELESELALAKQEASQIQRRLDQLVMEDLKKRGDHSAWQEARDRLTQLNADGILAFYNQEVRKSGAVGAAASIRELFQGLVFGAHDKEFCSKMWISLRQKRDGRAIVSKVRESVLGGAATTSCMHALMNACMDKSVYAADYFESLAHLANKSDANAEDHNAFQTLEGLIGFLDEKHPAQKGTLWGVGQVDAREHSIVSTPQFLDAQRTAISKDHTKKFVDAWAGLIAQTEEFVDITTLSVPEAIFVDALKASIERLDAKNKKIIVRILFGTNSPKTVQAVDVSDLMAKLSKDLPATSQLELSVGTYTANHIIGGEKLLSWNHSKIVAVDGKFMLTGGHNLYETYVVDPELKKDIPGPVHDLSALIPGQLAQIGHAFADRLWAYTWDHHVAGNHTYTGLGIRRSVAPLWGEVRTFRTHEGKIEISNKSEPTRYSQHKDASQSELAQELDAAHSEKVIAVGRLANLNKAGEAGNVSDTAIKKMIRDAKSSLYVSQQAILPLFLTTQFNADVVVELGQAVLRGVDVYVLVSSTQEQWVGKGAFGYSSGYDRQQTFDYFYNSLLQAKGTFDGAYETLIFQKLRKHFHILPTANNLHEVPNHAKLVVADGRVGYIGSHNFYDDSHAEFGVILGARGSLSILSEYFSPLWIASLTQGLDIEAHKDFAPSDFVFYSKGHDGELQDWPLARVISVDQDSLVLDLDYLLSVESEPRRILTIGADRVRKVPQNDDLRSLRLKTRSSSPPTTPKENASGEASGPNPGGPNPAVPNPDGT